MDHDRLLETERYHHQQIRDLDSEQLLIEEVEGLDDSSNDERDNDRDDGGPSSSSEFTFNPYLASLHTYLGETEDTHHRLACVDAGVILKVSLFYLEGVVLFPEATLPLRVIQPNFVSAVEKALAQSNAPYTIGVVRVCRDGENGRVKFATIGTTAEIRKFRRLEDGSLNLLTRGQQRFHLRRRWIDMDGSPCGEIQIIEEDIPLRTPRDAVGRLNPLKNFSIRSNGQQSLNRYCRNRTSQNSDSMSEDSFESELSFTEKLLHQSALASSYYGSQSDLESTSSGGDDDERSVYCSPVGSLDLSDERRREKKLLLEGKSLQLNRLREVPRTFCPHWVYRMYDSYCLAQRVAEMWRQIVGTPSMEGLERKPDILSFHIASKIPVSESTRQELLEIHGISYRLRREIELLESFDRVRCKICRTIIGKRSDMLVMSDEGPLGAYVNPHGYVHEIMTLYKAVGLALMGSAVKEDSWFPGYAWTIVYCATCECQMGWRFTATNKKLKPRSFWAIRSSQVADEAC